MHGERDQSGSWQIHKSAVPGFLVDIEVFPDALDEGPVLATAKCVAKILECAPPANDEDAEDHRQRRDLRGGQQDGPRAVCAPHERDRYHRHREHAERAWEPDDHAVVQGPNGRRDLGAIRIVEHRHHPGQVPARRSPSENRQGEHLHGPRRLSLAERGERLGGLVRHQQYERAHDGREDAESAGTRRLADGLRRGKEVDSPRRPHRPVGHAREAASFATGSLSFSHHERRFETRLGVQGGQAPPRMCLTAFPPPLPFSPLGTARGRSNAWKSVAQWLGGCPASRAARLRGPRHARRDGSEEEARSDARAGGAAG